MRKVITSLVLMLIMICAAGTVGAKAWDGKETQFKEKKVYYIDLDGNKRSEGVAVQFEYAGKDSKEIKSILVTIDGKELKINSKSGLYSGEINATQAPTIEVVDINPDDSYKELLITIYNQDKTQLFSDYYAVRYVDKTPQLLFTTDWVIDVCASDKQKSGDEVICKTKTNCVLDGIQVYRKLKIGKDKTLVDITSQTCSVSKSPEFYTARSIKLYDEASTDKSAGSIPAKATFKVKKVKIKKGVTTFAYVAYTKGDKEGEGWIDVRPNDSTIFHVVEVK